MGDHTGQRLGNYRLLRLIGQGGFADVYLGEHIHLRTQAAIKILQVRLGDNSIQDFLNEARTIAHLVHPYIIRVLDFGVQENTPFLVMDYAPRGTLRLRFLQGKPLAPGPLVPFIKQAASALQYGHERKLIHRDVKPENMLLGANDEVLLSDFGLAMIAFGSFSRATAQTAGTAAYMSPEQLQGKPRPASDQYSLAVIAYEWLTGTTPFQGSFYEIASQQMIASVPPIHQRIQGFPAGIEKVIMTGLEKDPRHRFPSVRDFALALEEVCLNQHQSGDDLSALSKTIGAFEDASESNAIHAKLSSANSPLGSGIVDPFEILSAARKNSALLDDPSLFGPWDKRNPSPEMPASMATSEQSGSQLQASTKTSTTNPTENTASALSNPASSLTTEDPPFGEKESKQQRDAEKRSENIPDLKKSTIEQWNNKNQDSNRSIFTREEHVISRFAPLPSQSNYPSFSPTNDSTNKNRPGVHTARMASGPPDQFALSEMQNANRGFQGSQPPLAPQQPLQDHNLPNIQNPFLNMPPANTANPISNNLPQNYLSGGMPQQNAHLSASLAIPYVPSSAPGQPSLSGIPAVNQQNLFSAHASLSGMPAINNPQNLFSVNPGQPPLSGIPAVNNAQNLFSINPGQASLSGVPIGNNTQNPSSANPIHNTFSGIPIVNNSQISFTNVPDTNNPQNPFANNLSHKSINNIPVNGLGQNVLPGTGTTSQQDNSFTVNLAQSSFANVPNNNNQRSGGLPGSPYGFPQNSAIAPDIPANRIPSHQTLNSHAFPGQINASAHFPSLPNTPLASKNSNLPPLVDVNSLPGDREQEEAVQQSLTKNIGVGIPPGIQNQSIPSTTSKRPGSGNSKSAVSVPEKRTFGITKYALITLVIIILFGSLMGGIYLISRNYTSPTPINAGPINAEPTVHTQAATYPTIPAVATTPSPNASGNPYVTNTNSTLSINDPLTSNQYGWYEGIRHPSNGVCTFTAGGYKVVAPSKIPVTLCGAANTNFTQFTYQVNLQFNSAAGAYSGAGIAFYANETTNEYYYFELYTLGGYALRDCTTTGCENYLVTGNTPPNAFKADTGDTNTLAVVVNRKAISLYLNKQLVKTFNEGGLTLDGNNREIGIAANAGYNADTGTYPITTVTFSNATVWKE